MEESYKESGAQVKLEAVERLKRYPMEPVVEWDEKTQILKTDDPAMHWLIRVGTNGEPGLIKRFMESANTRQALLRDAEGWIRLNLLASYLDQRQPVKDADKRILEMIREYAPAPHNRGKRAKTPEEPESHAFDKIAGNLLGMEKASKARTKT